MVENKSNGSERNSITKTEKDRMISLERLQALIRVSRQMFEEASPEGLMQRAADAALELTRAGRGLSGHGYENGGFSVEARARRPGIPAPSWDDGFSRENVMVYRGLLQEVASIRLTQSELATLSLERRLPAADKQPLRGLLGARVEDQEGELTGLILVADKEGEAFTPEDEAFLRELAAITSSSMHQVEAGSLQAAQATEAEEKGRILDAIMRYIPEGLTVAEAPDIRVREVSRYGVELTGRTREELLGTTADSHPSGWGLLHKHGEAPAGAEELPLTRAVRRGEVIENEEWIIERPDRTRTNISCNAGPILNEKGEITGGVIAWRDVTQQKKEEASLRGAWDDLEAEVWRRTSELQEAKQTLEREVKQHKRTASLLQESNEVLESIFANTHFLMAYMDRDFNFIRVNQAYADAAGKTVDFFPGRNHFELYPHEENQALFQSVLETGEPYVAIEKPFHHPDRPDRGETYWDWSLRPVWTEPGEVSGLLLGLMDVTDRVYAEQERYEGERKFRLLAESIEDVFWMSKSGITEMLYVSPAYEKVWGRSVASLYASPRSFIDAVHPEDRPRVVAELKRHATEGWNLEYRIVRPDGEVRWIRDRGFPLRDGKGIFAGMCGTASDITEVKEAEEAIRESERRYRELQERSLDGFARTDMENRFVQVNSAFENLVGYSESELQNMTVPDITPEKGFAEEVGMKQELRRIGHTPLMEKEFQRKDGTLVPVELRVHLTRGASGAPREMWAFIRDITERKQAEAEIRKNLEQLEQSNRDLGDFAYVTSHDLQEPLRKIQTFGDRLWAKYAEQFDDRGRDYLERMITAATRMRGLIEALLHYSRVSSRQQSFSEVNLGDAVQEALSNLEDRIDRSGGTVVVRDLPQVEGDSHQLVQLMQNLIGNALKFQRPGVAPHILIDYNTSPGPKPAGKRRSRFSKRCEVRIQDNGIGLDQAYADQIFKPFHRLHGRGEYEGVGMGLAICRKIVERHGGEIRVESSEGHGSVFIVSLPYKHPVSLKRG